MTVDTYIVRTVVCLKIDKRVSGFISQLYSDLLDVKLLMLVSLSILEELQISVDKIRRQTEKDIIFLKSTT